MEPWAEDRQSTLLGPRQTLQPPSLGPVCLGQGCGVEEGDENSFTVPCGIPGICLYKINEAGSYFANVLTSSPAT